MNEELLAACVALDAAIRAYGTHLTDVVFANDDVFLTALAEFRACIPAPEVTHGNRNETRARTDHIDGFAGHDTGTDQTGA